MRSFSYTKAGDVTGAVADIDSKDKAKFIAGGTNLLDLMKIDVMTPGHLVDITQLALDKIEENEEGGLRLGALVTNADTAYHEEVEKRYPLLSHAIRQVLRRSCATWLPTVATCCSARVVIIFMI